MQTTKSSFVTSRYLGWIATVVGIAATALVVEGTAQAQTYRGNAYGANIGINATLVGVGAAVVNTGNLPTTGSATPITNSLANANVQAQGSGGVGSLFTVLGAGLINSSTVGTGGIATSVTEITGLSLLPGLNIDLGLLGNLNLGVNALVGADVVRSTTIATAGGNTGRTEIANLRFGGVSLGNVDVTNGSSATYYLNILGGVNTTANAVVGVTDVAQLVINGQTLTDGGSTRTTDAIRVSILPSGQLATGNITVASSTAGVAGAAVVPEANTLSLVGLGAAALGGVTVRRRMQAKAQS